MLETRENVNATMLKVLGGLFNIGGSMLKRPRSTFNILTFPNFERFLSAQN